MFGANTRRVSREKVGKRASSVGGVNEADDYKNYSDDSRRPNPALVTHNFSFILTFIFLTINC
jgi:hypothetical protein